MLKVFNTLTQRIEPFKPLEDKKVKMFTCGPSVYRRPHIGNYRTFLYEDLLHRYLEYLGYRVVRLTSLTDIEDKAIIEAEKQQVSVKELAERNRNIFFNDSELLKIRNPDYSACMMACSSTAVDEAARLTKKLIEKSYAYYYKHEGRRNVYFYSLKKADFGKLSRLDIGNWPKKRRRFHRDTYPGTPWNKGDFILWHGFKAGDSDFWDTEVGKGRPSWNIQDAATITKYLGFTIDAVCGGIDNLVRHHDYTIAITESVSGGKLARYWFHGEHLFVNGEKMSKSKGNIYYPSDLIRKNFRGEHIRFFLIYEHYRRRLNYTFDKLEKASQQLDAFKSMVNNLKNVKSGKSSAKARRLVESIHLEFEKKMSNDLNVKGAFDSLFNLVTKLSALVKEEKLSSADARKAISKLKKVDSVLQLSL